VYVRGRVDAKKKITKKKKPASAPNRGGKEIAKRPSPRKKNRPGEKRKGGVPEFFFVQWPDKKGN